MYYKSHLWDEITKFSKELCKFACKDIAENDRLGLRSSLLTPRHLFLSIQLYTLKPDISGQTLALKLELLCYYFVIDETSNCELFP